MKRIVEIDGRRREFELIRADGEALEASHEFAVFMPGDHGYFVREGGEFIGLALFYSRRWHVSTSTLPGCYDDWGYMADNLSAACMELWRRREERVRKWRDELDVAKAVSFGI